MPLEAPAVFAEAREISKNLQEEEEVSRAIETAVVAAAAARSEAPRDESDELEATLFRGRGSFGPRSVAAESRSAAVNAAMEEEESASAAGLRRDLAAAAGNDDEAATGGRLNGGLGDAVASSSATSEVPSGPAATAKATAGYTSSAPAPHATPKTAAPAPAAAAPAVSAESAEPEASAAPARSAVEAWGGEDEIDALFGDFDVAVASLGCNTATQSVFSDKDSALAASATPAKAPKAPVLSTAGNVDATSKSTSAAKKVNDTDDIFGDVDAFLAELEA